MAQQSQYVDTSTVAGINRLTASLRRDLTEDETALATQMIAAGRLDYEVSYELEARQFPNYKLAPMERLANLAAWFNQGLVVCVEDYKGNRSSGRMESQPKAWSGVWGYGGDSIAVRVNGEAWPSTKVRPQ